MVAGWFENLFLYRLFAEFGPTQMENLECSPTQENCRIQFYTIALDILVLHRMFTEFSPEQDGCRIQSYTGCLQNSVLNRMVWECNLTQDGCKI